MQNKKIHIKEGDIATVVSLSKQIPEFYDPHAADEYEKRLKYTRHLILVAYDEEKAIGFKVGYERYDGFYSWMGAILPAYRKLGIASALAKKQEVWAKQKGFSHVTFKTRNRLKGMLIFALKNKFNIIGLDKKEGIDNYRIVLRKKL